MGPAPGRCEAPAGWWTWTPTRQENASRPWRWTSATRLGITSRDVDNALYNAFGQRQVATMYDEVNQYRVIMQMAPRYIRSPRR